MALAGRALADTPDRDGDERAAAPSRPAWMQVGAEDIDADTDDAEDVDAHDDAARDDNAHDGSVQVRVRADQRPAAARHRVEAYDAGDGGDADDADDADHPDEDTDTHADAADDADEDEDADADAAADDADDAPTRDEARDAPAPGDGFDGVRVGDDILDGDIGDVLLGDLVGGDVLADIDGELARAGLDVGAVLVEDALVTASGLVDASWLHEAVLHERPRRPWWGRIDLSLGLRRTERTDQPRRDEVWLLATWRN